MADPKKLAVPVVAGILALAAIVFYVAVVRTAGARRQEAIETVRRRYEELRAAAGAVPHPNDDDIVAARQSAEAARRRIEEATKFFAGQRRNCHTRKFYINPYAFQRTEVPLAFQWNDLYEQRKLELQQQLALSGVGRVGISLPQWSGAGLPDEVWIRRAMVLFWLHRDLVDLLANREAVNTEEYLRSQGDIGASTLYDLVRNRNPREPRQTLVQLVQQDQLKADDLRGILKDMLFSPDGWHLGRLLGEKYRLADGRGVWDVIEGQVLTATQRTILEDLRKDNDYSRLYDFANDLRLVRYREDIADIARNRGEEIIVEYLRRPDLMPESKLRAVIDNSPEWNVERIAQVVGALCALGTREDFDAVLKNHGTPPLVLTGFQVGVGGAAVRGGPGGPMIFSPEMMEPGMEMEGPGMTMPSGPAAAGPADPFPVTNNLYYELPFTMSVTLEFQKLPAFLRRLYELDWRIQVTNLQISKTTAGAATGPTPAATTGLLGRPGAYGGEYYEEMLMEEPSPVAPEMPVVARPEMQRLVLVQLTGKAYSFYPLKRSLEQAPSGATPTP